MNGRELLVNLGMDQSMVFDGPSYDNAIIGYEHNTERVVYDYEAMAEDMMKQDGIEYEDAVEFIDYNTLRAVPYAGLSAPIVMYPIVEMDYFFEMIGDGNDFIRYNPTLKDYDNAIIGHDATSGRVVYDFEKMVAVMMGQDSLSYECAVEEIKAYAFGDDVIIDEDNEPIVMMGITDYLDYAEADKKAKDENEQ